METSAPAIFEIGFVLLVAAIAGWLARRAGLPAVLGYLATGLIVWSVLQDVAGVTLAIVALIGLRLQATTGFEAVELALLYVILVVVATGLLPRLLRQLHQEHDLFLIVSVAGALALAGVGARFFGIPLALAAFVSGLAISESREATEARERLLPFRDVFAVLFFVAIGALIDPAALLKGLGWISLLLALLVVDKVAPIYLLARFGRLPGRPRQIATGLGQIGEFSFVLATIGVTRQVIPGELYAAILAAVVVTIAASTLLVRLGYSRPAGARKRGLKFPKEHRR